MWREDYPKTDERSPSRPWDEAGAALGFFAEDSKWPFPSLWLSAEGTEQTITIDRDRFSLTWSFSETEPKKPYPGYIPLKAELERRFAAFGDAVEHEVGIRPVPMELEIRYTNELEGETLGQVLNSLLGVPPEGPPFGLPDYLGLRFHTCASPDTRGSSILVGVDADLHAESPSSFFVLASRDHEDTDTVWKGLDEAHDALIERFTHLLTPTLNKIWGARS